jgi:hypothetical protein
MRLGILTFAVAGGILASMAASAKVPVLLIPKLSGTYAVSYTEICQAGLSAPTNPGSVTVESVTATFDAHKVTIAGTKTSGDLVVPKGFVGGTFFHNPVSKSYKYSNDATTLTIDGIVFNAVYGPKLQQIAQSLVFSGASNAGCAVSATGFKQ